MSSDPVGKRQSRQARGYGHAAERHVIDEYDLELDHDSWHDAQMDGDPVEIKAAKYRLDNGREGRYLIRRPAHRKLRQSDGWYAFVVYRGRGRGIEVAETKMIRSRSVRIDSWQSLSDRSDEKQIRISQI